MPRPDFPRTVFDFQRRFSTEEACLAYLIESRWPEGFVCPRCEFTVYWWKAARKLLQCKRCGYQASVTAGTVMHRTKQPLTLWFWAAYLITTHTPGMSALQFQRQVGIASYETAFNMLHKLRAAMVREGREQLRGVVEADETYVGGRQAGPGGRGARGKAIVAATVEVRGTHAGRARLRVVSDASSESLLGFLADTVEIGTEVRTDGWKGYAGLTEVGYVHVPFIEPTPKATTEALPHVHRVFSNLKSWLVGTHHGVSPHHLQAYLNEFVFRFNRRKTPMAAFQTVLGLIDERLGPTYEGLYGIATGEPEAWTHPINPQG